VLLARLASTTRIDAVPSTRPSIAATFFSLVGRDVNFTLDSLATSLKMGQILGTRK
jgi:hypothetical protein